MLFACVVSHRLSKPSPQSFKSDPRVCSAQDGSKPNPEPPWLKGLRCLSQKLVAHIAELCSNLAHGTRELSEGFGRVCRLERGSARSQALHRAQGGLMQPQTAVGERLKVPEQELVAHVAGLCANSEHDSLPSRVQTE